MTPPGQEGFDPRELLSALRRRGWILVLCLVVIPAATYAYSRGLTKVYESSVTVQPQPTASDAGQLVTGDFAPPSQQSMATVASLAETSGVSDEAARLLHAPLGSVHIVNTTADEDTGFLKLAASGPTPRRAQEVANAFATALGNTRQRRGVRRVDDAITGVSGALRSERDPVQRGQLRDQLSKLRTLRSAQGENVQVIEPAGAGSLLSPHPARNAILAAIVALLIGFGLIFLAERFDRRLRKPDELERLAEVPLLSTIPSEAFPGGPPSALVPQAFQTLRDGLTYFNVDRSISSVMVVSALKGEGKTTVATNLAVAMARAGRRVVLMEADLRSPQIAARLGLDGAVGLSNVLVGAPPESALREVAPFGEALRVLPAGPIPPNPSELIGSKRMTELLAELSDDADMVIVDTPPILPVSDAYPLLERVSGAVAIARLNRTPREAFERMYEIVATARGRVLGIVATDARRPGDYGYGAYGYGYGLEAAPTRPGPRKAEPVARPNGVPIEPTAAAAPAGQSRAQAASVELEESRSTGAPQGLEEASAPQDDEPSGATPRASLLTNGRPPTPQADEGKRRSRRRRRKR